jgi:hypothetical protein
MPNLAIYRGVPKRANGISALSIKEQGYKRTIYVLLIDGAGL